MQNETGSWEDNGIAKLVFTANKLIEIWLSIDVLFQKGMFLEKKMIAFGCR